MNGPETRQSLLENLKSPQADESWIEFAAIYRPLIFRVAVAKGLQHADADDLTQEVMATVEKSLDSYEASRGSFRSWLYQVTRNLVVNHLTRRRGPIGTGDSHVARFLAEHPDANDDTATLFKLEYRRIRFQEAAAVARNEFQDSTWNAFWMTAVGMRSIQSVAAELGRSEGAVRVARCRVLNRIREIVSEQADGFDP